MGHSGRGLLVCQNFQNYKTLGLETKKTHFDGEKKITPTGSLRKRLAGI